MNRKILVVGAGLIGQEYARVLKKLNIEFDSICRSKLSAENFKCKTGLDCSYGGIESILDLQSKYSHVIVASEIDKAFSIIQFCISNGIKNILAEKPGALNFEEILKIKSTAEKFKSNVDIAYNRRYYESIIKLKEISELDGGIESCHFDFTEWSHEIIKLGKSDEILKNWFLLNSSHVVDAAFYLIGKPKEISCFQQGMLSWHSPAVFTGAGISEKNVLFTYNSNWLSTGRWSIEVKTKKRALRLMPMEKLSEQKIGELSWNDIPLTNEHEIEFKHGFFKQIQAFILEKDNHIKSIDEQVLDIELYKKILGINV
jgi:predicted dehydrogenase